MRKRWVSKPPADEAIYNRLKKELQTSEILLKLIAQRNISTLKEAHSYFVPSLDALYDPMLMKGMKDAVTRIHRAVVKKEKIVVYGDYDVDGTTSVALVYSFFRKFHDNIEFYIPDRFKEGYGISKAGIDWAKEIDAKLIIALDCGIKSVDLVQYASHSGIDFIICDHHTPGDTVPEALAVLNPKQSDCSYPYKDLSGCGIGYKLLAAYAATYHIPWDRSEYLDLVAISIASDIVPMTGENRILANFGLQKVNTHPRPGVAALMSIAGVKNDMSINDLVFKLGPRINAAGRISSGKLAVEMLIETDRKKALETAGQVDKNNVDRQSVDQSITKQALEMIENNLLTDRKTTVLYSPEWHKGVIGIVASRLIEKYYRPTVLLTESNGYAVGSARSVPGFNLYEAIRECDDLLDQWGGHQAAAGLTMRIDKVSEFMEKFEEAVSKSIPDELLTPVLEYDQEITLDTISQSFCKSIERFGPFGPENMKPVFISLNVQQSAPPRAVGKNHIQMFFKGANDIPLKAIAFGFGEFYENIRLAETLNICYTIEPDYFRGNYDVSLNIKDIQTV